MLPLQNPSVVKTLHRRSSCDGVAKSMKKPQGNTAAQLLSYVGMMLLWVS